MRILGINQVPSMIAWQHDSAAALVIDGKIVAAAEEERFNRVRHARGYPHKAVEYCLKEGGLSMKDIDIIAISYNPWKFLTTGRVNLLPMNLIKDIANLVLIEYYTRKLAKDAGARRVYIDHHHAHAASAFYCSGFDEANVLTIDGSGETESFAFFEGKKGRLRRIWDMPLGSAFMSKKWNSIGLVYTRVTNYLNLGVHGEGKTMGLASYGNPVYDFSRILNIRSHTDFNIDRRLISEMYPDTQRKDAKGPIEQKHKDLAASLQKALEDSIVNLAREAHTKTGHRKFALAGGVALNCNTNSKILDQEFCHEIYVQPAASDGGAALGAALAAAAMNGDSPEGKMQTAYWGPGYTNEEIEKTLKEAKVPYRRSQHIEAETAKHVAEGKIVGWFQGRSELGPRALGNRSILANPAIKGMNDKVNVEVKHREVWRPFAPSVTKEDAPKYFEGLEKMDESPFMLQTHYVRKEYRDKLPAITHVDGSARIQTVTKEQNPRYYAFLKELEKLTGMPITMNTSFNDVGEPIVQTPKDALRCFFATGFDVLAIGDFLVEKTPAV